MSFTRRSLLGWFSVILFVGLPAQLSSTTVKAKVYPKKIPFEDTDAFDAVLSKSMSEGFEAIDVELPQASSKRMPPRVRAWIESVANTNGEVRFRDVTPKSRGIWVILIEVIASIVGSYIVEEVRKAMRSPATDYHAVIVGQGTDPASAELLGVEFYRRGSPSWAEAYDNSKAMKLRS